MPNFLGLGQNVDIRICLDEEDTRQHEEMMDDDCEKRSFPVYYDGETVSGQVLLGMKRGSKLDHQGIRIELLGFTEYCTDRDGRYEFLSRVQDLARPGILSQPTAYPFEFLRVFKPYERYRGKHIRVRYILRVVVQRRLTDLTKVRELSVHTFLRATDPDEGIQMEVGIEGSLHIELQFNKSSYHLHDVIIGKIFFSLVHVKIKNMEIQILKRETVGYGPAAFSDSQTVAKYEIMDGAPVRGESIPIRLFLRPYNLDPTMVDAKKRFFVRYFLNIVLLDEEDRRYYKQQEIILYRRPESQYRASRVPKQPVQPADKPQPVNGNGTVDAQSGSETADQSSCTGDDAPQSDIVACSNGNTQPSSSGSTETSNPSTSASSSPDPSRASRSMSRYEPKARQQESVSVQPATVEVDDTSTPSPPSTPKQHCVMEDVHI